MADAQVMFDRTVSITRPNPTAAAGDAGYLGPEAVNETVVLGGASGTTPLTTIAASIQYDRSGNHPLAGLPADTESRSTWRIFLDPASGVRPEQIQRNDIVTDDAGLRYQVDAPFYSPLGLQIRAEFLPN